MRKHPVWVHKTKAERLNGYVGCATTASAKTMIQHIVRGHRWRRVWEVRTP